MLTWTHKNTTESYQTNTGKISLDLSHSYPGKRWFLIAKTTKDCELKLKTMILADPDNTDINDVKSRSEQAMIDAMENAIKQLQAAIQDLKSDMSKPMPSTLEMAEATIASYLAAKKHQDSTGETILDERWENYSENVITSYVERNIMTRFGLTKTQFDEIKAKLEGKTHVGH